MVEGDVIWLGAFLARPSLFQLTKTSTPSGENTFLVAVSTNPHRTKVGIAATRTNVGRWLKVFIDGRTVVIRNILEELLNFGCIIPFGNITTNKFLRNENWLAVSIKKNVELLQGVTIRKLDPLATSVL